MTGSNTSTPFRSRASVNPLFLSILGGFKKSGRLLDLGCNTGTELLYAARHGWMAEGCDIDAQAIAEANEIFFRGNATNVSAYHMSMQQCVEQTPHTYDLITSIDALSFLPLKHAYYVLSRIPVLLNTNGIVLLRVFTTQERLVTKRRDRTFFHYHELGNCMPGLRVISKRQEAYQDPGHVGRPEPHEHQVQVFIAQKV